MVLNFFISAFMIFIVSDAIAGANSSGGGGAYVCRDESGEIKSALLVDLWESQKSPFNWNDGDATTVSIQYDDADVDTQIDRAMTNLSRLDSGLGAIVKKELIEIKKSIHELPADVALTIPNDLQTDYYPKGCPPEGMFRYNGTTSKLDVASGIFDKLTSPTDKAAAFVHEAIYKVFRESAVPAQSSVLVRRLVACLFSQDCLAQAEFNPPKDKRAIYSCSTDDTKVELTAFPEEEIADPAITNGKWKFMFQKFDDSVFGTWVGYSVHFKRCESVGKDSWCEAVYACSPENYQNCKAPAVEGHPEIEVLSTNDKRRNVRLTSWLDRFGFIPVIDEQIYSDQWPVTFVSMPEGFRMEQGDLADAKTFKLKISMAPPGHYGDNLGSLYSGLPGYIDKGIFGGQGIDADCRRIR